MKRLFGNILKLIIIITLLASPVLVFKLGTAWGLTVLFILNFALLGSAILMGTGMVITSFVFLSAAYIVAVMKALGASLPLWPYGIELVISIISFMLVKKSEDFNEYYMSSMSDELKELEANNDAMLIEKKNVEHALENNRSKLANYEKLEEIHKNVREIKVFSEKMRYILRSIIKLFHEEKAIYLFLIKENKIMKVMADKEDDLLVGEKDQDSLFLKNFDEWAIENKQSILISDMHREIRFKQDGDTGIRSLISVPVMMKDQVVGLIRVVSDAKGCFHQEDLRFLDLIAGVVSKVLEVEQYV